MVSKSEFKAVAIFLANFSGCVNLLFIVEVKIHALIKQVLPIMLTIESRILSFCEHAV